MSNASPTKVRNTGSVVLGVAGAGEFVRMVASGLRAHGGIRVAAISSRNEAPARELAAELGGAAFDKDFSALIRRPEVEAVYIATPPHLHHAMMIAAIEAGKHVICEKPFVMNLRELDDIERVVESHPGIKVSSCSCRFQVSPVRRARDYLKRGQLGKLHRVRLSNAMPPPPPLAGLPVWKRNCSTAGGGIAMDWGVYDLDWLQFLLGDSFDPVEVFGKTDCWLHQEAALEKSFSAEILCRSGLTVGWERRSEQGPPFQRAEIRGSGRRFRPSLHAGRYSRGADPSSNSRRNVASERSYFGTG